MLGRGAAAGSSSVEKTPIVTGTAGRDGLQRGGLGQDANVGRAVTHRPNGMPLAHSCPLTQHDRLREIAQILMNDGRNQSPHIKNR